MSHYSVARLHISRKSALLSALKAMGFASHMVEVSETLLPLRGYRGDTREQAAHVRIKGAGWAENYVGIASNDLGFELQPDGTYLMHVSEFDSRRYGAAWQQRLMNQYAKATVEEVAVEQNWSVEEEVGEGGEIRMLLRTVN